MPNLREYRILISHSWDYNQHYETIINWLNNTGYFKWVDYSAPITNPLSVSSKKELQERIRSRIANCSCVIILSGMYVAYSEWIDYEIDTAIAYGKPIIGIKPWGQGRVPTKVSNNADIIVGWNSESLIRAIRNYALR